MLTNPILESLHTRKSVRVYQDTPLPDEVTQAILQAAIQAPTAGNMALYTILHITAESIKAQLAQLCDNQPFIAQAPFVLVFVADYHRWQTRFRTALNGPTRPLGLGDLLLAASDTLIAAQNAVVAAESLGVGSCYIGDIIENFEAVQQLLRLPPETAPVAMLCMGYPTAQQQQREKPPRFAQDMLVFENTYPDDITPQALRMRSAAQTVPFYNRKFASDFSEEMNRSAQIIYKNWSCEHL